MTDRSTRAEDLLGPWRAEDFSYRAFLADDRPNPESHQARAKYYVPLIPERIVKGQNGEVRFRVAPRTSGLAGILVLDKEGKPVPRSAGLQVVLTDETGKPVEGIAWDQRDTKILFSDASPVILPKTRIAVLKANKPLDEATVDFSQWSFVDSEVQMSRLLDGPTWKHGFVVARDGQFLRDGKPMYFWGGHENHVPGKPISDKYADVYSLAGINVMRSIAIEETVADPATGGIDREQLDKYHYLIAKLGEKGIYFLLTGYPGYLSQGIYGFEKGKPPPYLQPGSTFNTHFWISPDYRKAWKSALRTVLTTPNPHNGGRAIKDDPTVIGIELSNETGMNERRFDFNRLDTPEVTAQWREAFNAFLLKKYGGRDALAKAWERHPLRPHEDPARGTILIPSNYRGARSPYGGTGQHDQFLTGRWYLPFGVPASANPRVVDAIEFNNTVAKKPFPFDFNDPTQPEQTNQLREAFNAFLLKKYGDASKLGTAWAEDPLNRWEDPAKNSILIPTPFLGQTSYEVSDARVADPRIGDAMEFTCEVQRNWASDMANFLKNEIGMKCGIGWNGDTFHVVQAPNHLANMNSPLDIAIAAAYLDWDNGDQTTSRTKNLKRFLAYGRIHGRPMFSYEWSYWLTQGMYSYEYCLLAALMGRVYGFDGYSHHKMAAYKYPISDPIYSMPGHDYIQPLSDRPRRGAFEIAQWIMQRSKITEDGNRLLVGMPYDDVFTGGPERKMSNWAFENWLMYQIGVEDYAFRDVYDGPADRVVVHDGRGPYGDYRKAKHAILWCHSRSDREGKDPNAREKWFALHGIRFDPGQKYFLNDQFFATTEDMTEYNVVHQKAEQARWKAISDTDVRIRQQVQFRAGLSLANDVYWDAEPDARPTELDCQIYQALKRWGFPLPFEENEIDKVWRSRDRTMIMDTTKMEFRADRDDMQLWFGKLEGKGGKVSLSKLEATSTEKQYSVALLPWDTSDFKTAKTLVVWSHWNSEVTLKLKGLRKADIYAVNWLGKRLYRVKPISASRSALTFATIRDDDVFCYEIVR